MEEIINIDGRQYKLIYDRQLTAEQREQAIANVRKSDCGCGNNVANLGQIQSLQGNCASVTLLAPANISISDITIGGIICGTGTCPTSLICPTPDCTALSVNVVVTWGNSGDVQATLATPTLTVGGGVPITGPSTIVAASLNGGITLGTGTTTFSTVSIPRGTNISVCADSGPISP